MGDHTQTDGDNVAGLTSARSTGIGKSEESARRLIHIPIIHSQAEMGSLSPTIRAMTVRRLGAQGLEAEREFNRRHLEADRAGH